MRTSIFVLVTALAGCSSESGPAQPADLGKACSHAADCESICVASCDAGPSGTCGRPTAENCNVACQLGDGDALTGIPCN